MKEKGSGWAHRIGCGKRLSKNRVLLNLTHCLLPWGELGMSCATEFGPSGGKTPAPSLRCSVMVMGLGDVPGTTQASLDELSSRKDVPLCPVSRGGRALGY